MRAKHSALTLAEVIVALGVIALVTLSLLAAFMGGYRVMQQSTQLTMATDTAREFLETTKSLGYDQTAVGTYDGRIPAAPDTSTGFPPAPYPVTQRDAADYTLLVTCTQHTPTTRLVTVRVFWGTDHKTEIATMLHR